MKASYFARFAATVALLAATHANAANETYPLNVPTDTKATYELMKVGKGEKGNIIAITKRTGPSGVSFAKREFNCRDGTMRYLNEGDTLEEVSAKNPKYHVGKMAPASGSISGDVRVALCGYTEAEKFWNTVAMKIAIDKAVGKGTKP